MPENPRGFLTDVIRNQVKNHQGLKRLQAKEGVDLEAEVSPGLDPEESAERAEQKARLFRHIGSLPAKEAAVVRCIIEREASPCPGR